MNKRRFIGSLLGFLVALPLGIASAAGGGGGEPPSAERQWCRGGTIANVYDPVCGHLLYRHCLGGRDSGQTQQVGMACS